MAHPGGYWIIAAIAGLLALLTLIGSLKRLRRNRFIADTPLVRMRSAAQGYVRVEGRAQPPPNECMKAPLSGRACVWWDFRVDYKERTRDGTTLHRAVRQGVSVSPFVLQDAEGACLIGPVGAEVTATSSDTWAGLNSHPSGPPPRQSFFSLRDSGDYIYHERLIAPGSRLCVLGELRSHTEFGAVDAKTCEILTQWKRDQPGLLRRFDANHDGHIDAGEWESATAAAHQQAEDAVLRSPIERVGVIGQTTHGGPFLIAPFDGEQVVRRERRRAMALLAASVLSLATGIWALSRTTPPSSQSADGQRQEVPT